MEVGFGAGLGVGFGAGVDVEPPPPPPEPVPPPPPPDEVVDDVVAVGLAADVDAVADGVAEVSALSGAEVVGVAEAAALPVPPSVDAHAVSAAVAPKSSEMAMAFMTIPFYRDCADALCSRRQEGLAGDI